jgi:uncharacterized protein (TIGR02145 family)
MREAILFLFSRNKTMTFYCSYIFDMLNNNLTYLFLLTAFIILTSCKKVEKVMMVTTGTASDINYNTATVTGQIVDIGEGATQYGHYYSTIANETSSGLKNQLGNPFGKKEFTSQLTGLTAGTKYFVKSYISLGTEFKYGKEISFTTISASQPTLTTIAITSITTTTATSGGNITSDGGANITSRGVCWSLSSNPTILNSKTSDGVGTGNFISNLTGLLADTTYFVRAYATNSTGTSYGNQISFRTEQIPPAPLAITNSATQVSQTGATLNALVNANNLNTTVTFEYGLTTSYGLTINAIPNIFSGSATTSVIANLTGLTSFRVYHYRVKAVNSSGTSYGSDVTFTTSDTGLGGIIFNPSLTYGSVSDMEGNSYLTIEIGTQTWMAENLKSTKYNDGSSLSYIPIDASWGGLTLGAYGWYNNDAAQYKSTHGALYNWYAVADSRNLCPTGWHIPTDAEWTILRNYLGGTVMAGGKLKETGTSHWNSPNTNATNETGFTALPGGFRDASGTFRNLGSAGKWWSSTFYPTWPEATSWYLSNNYASLTNEPAEYIKYGLSVRCILGPRASTVPFVLSSLTDYATNTANLVGTINSEGGDNVISRGVCWSISTNPTILDNKTSDGTGPGSFNSNITGLIPNTKYYVRAYATNSVGTAYGYQVSFTTYAATDIQGNNYTSVIIGTQTWLRQNLKVTRLNDNTIIPNWSDNSSWESLTSPGYCWYNNDPSMYEDTYGVLYNWYAVNTGKLCPTGWHVPTDYEWTTLTNYLGGESAAGGKLKETGTNHWQSPNTGATNESFFTALPGGGRDNYGVFRNVGLSGAWWSATEYSTSFAWHRNMFFDNTNAQRGGTIENDGYSVRCIKD